MYKLSKKYKYVVYGAAVMGGYVEAGLRKAGYCVSVFLDKRAEIIRVFRGITVEHPEQYVNENKDNTVVIVAIQNPFEQPNVAKYLWECGYTKIVYKMSADNSIHSEYAQRLYKIYENILLGNVDERQELYDYSEGMDKVYFEDGALNSRNNDVVVAYVPVEIIHTDLFNPIRDTEMEKYNQAFWDYLDKPLYLADKCLLNLFGAFEGKHDVKSAIMAMREFCNNNPWRYSSFAKTGQDVIENRYKIYLNMSKMLNRGMDFFIDNPIELKWNDKGYFNCSDGFHRACFLLTKGLTKIPARMKIEEYKKWTNKDKLESCIAHLRENGYPATLEPLPHPNFYNYKSIQNNVGITQMQYIMEYLYSKLDDISNLTYLYISSGISYFPWFIEKMGASVTILEEMEQYYNLVSSFNELFEGKNIEILCGDINVLMSKRDITIMFDCIQSEWQKMQKILEKTTRYLIISVGGGIENIYHTIDRSLFTKYEKIATVYQAGECHEIGAFHK